MKPMVKPKVTFCTLNPVFSTGHVEDMEDMEIKFWVLLNLTDLMPPGGFFILQLHMKVHMKETFVNLGLERYWMQTSVNVK